jgi:hypothetical protein
MRHPVLRTIVCIIGALLALAALLLAAFGCYPPAGIVGFWALIFLGGLVIERWRYKPLADRSPGPDWQLTDERFVDPETGKLVTVYFHPPTGERRYIGP